MSQRTLIEITGPDRIKFLQGLITNDARRLERGEMIYAAILTPQGKLIVDFFIAPLGEMLLLDVAAAHGANLLKRLTMYKLRSDVMLSLSERLVSRGIGTIHAGAFGDPRHADMGWRAYDGRPNEDVDWDAVRVAHCIPEMDIELTADTFILEAGFEALQGVDFKKGCYVGQEVTARMKHKTELRKGFKQVTIEGSAPVGAEIKNTDDKIAGTLFTQSRGKAIAYLRFDRISDAMSAGEAIVRI